MLATLTLTLVVASCTELAVEPVTTQHVPLRMSTTSGLSVTPNPVSVPERSTVQLVAKDALGQAVAATWTTSSASRATVSSTGLVTGVDYGTATITATANGMSASTTVYVTIPTTTTTPTVTVASVVVTPSTSSLLLGGVLQLSAKAYDASGNALTGISFSWSSSNSLLAAVSSLGVVTALGTGTVSITATAGGKSGSASISLTAPLVPPPTAPPPTTPTSGIWLSGAEIAALPISGSGWLNVKARADTNCGLVDLANQDQNNNVCILAKALVYARIGGTHYRDAVVAALRSIATAGTYSGTALSLGRELAAYVVAADIINLAQVDPTLDAQFRTKLRALLTTYTINGPANLIDCHEKRPNNWGTHCGASRIAVAAYLNDSTQLARAALVFRGWLGDRTAYTGFSYGDLSWQCNPSAPVGINPAGCLKNGRSVDGVLPDDQRRGGTFFWPPPKENYVYEALQGAVVQANLLARRGYPAWSWSNSALLRAFNWLHTQALFPASGDDSWQPHLINRVYAKSFPAPLPAQPGKNMGWTDWTHR